MHPVAFVYVFFVFKSLRASFDNVQSVVHYGGEVTMRIDDELKTFFASTTRFAISRSSGANMVGVGMVYDSLGVEIDGYRLCCARWRE